MKPLASHTVCITMHSAVHIMLREEMMTLRGPLGTVHVNTAVYDRQSRMALECVQRDDESFEMRVYAPSKHMLKAFCTIFKSYMEGVTQGFLVRMEAVGVGYKIHVEKQTVTFKVGLSHTVSVMIPPDIQLFLPKPTQLLVFGIDKQRVTQVVAQLRAIKLPEPYKGKGLRRKLEHVLRKEGKKK